MARVTVEDCIEKVPNRFELVMMAAQRTRKIGTGAPLTVDRDNDKNPVVSLREIAEETVDIGDLKEELIKNHQHVIEMDDEEDVKEAVEKLKEEFRINTNYPSLIINEIIDEIFGNFK